MKKIVLIAAEAMPFAATGGLGDVLGSLPTAIAKVSQGEADVRVILPLYGTVARSWRTQMTKEAEYTVSLSWRKQYCGVYRIDREGVICYLIDNEYYFKRDGLYGFDDDGERFAFFCKAAVELFGVIGWIPDILHAHDWQAALSVIYWQARYRERPAYRNSKTVFTIHNIEYQGKYDLGMSGDVFELGDRERETAVYGGCINLMKGAIVAADRVSTVSPRYAEEIQTPEYAHGLDSVLREHAAKLCGILNGIDVVYYDPAHTPGLAVPFDAETIENKYCNKTALQRELGLPIRQNVPLLAVISRLASHKGLDLIAEMVYNFIREHDVQLVILGKGESRYESFFSELAQTFPDRVRALIAYDRNLASRIYAATDIFWMPSRSEPCGLAQMIASRYGAIPVVRETGGLYDSIHGYEEKADGTPRGNGFTFGGYSAEELAACTEAALRLWYCEPKRRRLVEKIMRTDFSWRTSAQQYVNMYASL